MCHHVSSYEIQEDVSSCVILWNPRRCVMLWNPRRCVISWNPRRCVIMCHHVSSYEIQEDVSCYEIQDAVDFIRGFHKCTHTLHYFLSQMCHLMKSCIHPRSWIYAAADRSWIHAAARTHIDIICTNSYRYYIMRFLDPNRNYSIIHNHFPLPLHEVRILQISG